MSHRKLDFEPPLGHAAFLGMVYSISVSAFDISHTFLSGPTLRSSMSQPTAAAARAAAALIWALGDTATSPTTAAAARAAAAIVSRL